VRRTSGRGLVHRWVQRLAAGQARPWLALHPPTGASGAGIPATGAASPAASASSAKAARAAAAPP